MKKAALFAALLAGCSHAEPRRLLLTGANRCRHDPAGESMSGGWGPQLRSLLRAPDGSLWFGVEEGWPRNETLRLLRWDGRSWSERAALRHVVTFKQNVALVMSGATIHAYGVGDGGVEEGTVDTATGEARCARLPLDIAPNSQYVGAAVDPAGRRVVWWVTVGRSWTHVWHDGNRWHEPVETPLPAGGTSFGYVFAAWSGGRLALLGELYEGVYPRGSYAAAVTELEPGMPAAPFRVLATTTLGGASQDLWTGAGEVRALVKTDAGLSVWRRLDDWEEVGRHDGVYVGRFDVQGCVLTSPSASAIYVERAAQQTTPVRGGALAVCGAYPDHDHEIEFVEDAQPQAGTWP